MSDLQAHIAHVLLNWVSRDTVNNGFRTGPFAHKDWPFRQREHRRQHDKL